MLIKLTKLFSVTSDYLLGLMDKRLLDVTNLSDTQIAYIQQLVNDIRK